MEVIRYIRGGRAKVLRLALVVACLLLFACGREAGPLNVLIIGVDTLRADHLSCYGYERDTSPYLTEFAEEGVLFENVVSQCPWTLPSFATIFTSLYPTQNGTGSFMNKMRTSFPTLAEMLAEQGYITGAIVNVPLLRPEFGALRGFEYQDLHITGMPRIADQVTADALEWIDANSDRPFLLFAHYFDPHYPYTPPPPYDTLYDPGYTGKVGRATGGGRVAADGPHKADQLDSYTAADKRHLVALYDGEIAFTDSAVAGLVRGLEERGLRDETLIVFLSDHGEEFFEHGGVGHGHSLYNELLRVPLIISLPGKVRVGARVSRQVRLVDVTPTIMDVLGLELSPGFEGVSLERLLTGAGGGLQGADKLFAPGVAFSEAMQRGPEKKSVTSQSYKLIYDLAENDMRLFNVETDPGEQTDVAEENPELLSSLETTMLSGMLPMCGTWYMRMASGGETHRFDALVSAGGDSVVGRVHAVAIVDETGRRTAPGGVRALRSGGTALEVSGLETAGSLVLAFKPETPSGVPIRFDLKIDGRPAAAMTFVGKKGKNPKKMPFARLPSRATTESAAGPPDKPAGPCFQVWYAEGRFAGQETADIADETRRELKSLGYIQ